MLTVNSLKKKVGDKLQSWFGPMGFEFENGVDGVELFRWKDNVYTSIACIINRIGGHNRIIPLGQLGFRDTNEIYQRFMLDPDLPIPNRSVDLTIKYSNLENDWNAKITCNEEKELDDMYSKLQDAILEKLFPALTEYSDPNKLVKLYVEKNETDSSDLNLPAWHGYSSAVTGLILSKLYAPKYYETLKKRYEALFEKELSQEETRAKVDALISHLENHHV